MIYVCVPVHNEAATVGVLLWKSRKVLAEFGRVYQVVAMDDASTDDTYEVLQRYRRALPLTVLRSERRLGYGGAVDGLLEHVVEVAKYPKRDCAVVLQGDFTEHPEGVVNLVKALEGGADIVAGTTAASGGRAPRGRRFARWAAPLTLGRAFGEAPVSDPLTGLRAYRVIVLKKAFRERAAEGRLVASDGWAANVELLGRLAPHARRIAEAPTEVRHDLRARPSRFRPVRTLLGLAGLRGARLWSSLDGRMR